MKKHIREIKVKDLILYYYLTLVILIAIWTFVILNFTIIKFYVWIIFPIAIILTYATLHYHVIGMVLMYKAYAPLEVRDRCLFVPTCSTYMIMAIQKYGLLIGVIKGIKRIRRCHLPNGGVDYP